MIEYFQKFYGNESIEYRFYVSKSKDVCLRKNYYREKGGVYYPTRTPEDVDLSYEEYRSVLSDIKGKGWIHSNDRFGPWCAF